MRYIYDPQFAITEWNERLACWNSPEAARFIEAMDARIDDFETNGRLEEIFGSYQ